MTAAGKNPFTEFARANGEKILAVRCPKCGEAVERAAPPEGIERWGWIDCDACLNSLWVRSTSRGMHLITRDEFFARKLAGSEEVR